MRKFLISVVGLALMANNALAEQKAEEKTVTAQKTEPVAEKAAAPTTTTATANAPATEKAAAPAGEKATPPTAEQTPQPDARIKAALDRMQLKYTLDARGTYRVVFNIGDRKQNVFLHSHTERFLDTEIRLISSTAYRVAGALPGEKAAALLIDNGQRKIGAWRTLSQDGSTYVIYVVQIPANADDNLLRTAIAAAMQTADEMEKQETGKDEF